MKGGRKEERRGRKKGERNEESVGGRKRVEVREEGTKEKRATK